MTKKQPRNRARYRKSTLDAVPTAGQLLTEGRILEVIQPKSDGPLALLLSDGRHHVIKDRLQIDGKQRIAPAIEDSVFSKMRLPRVPRRFDSVSWLLDGIAENVSRYTGLPSELGKLIARFCLCSWICEALPSRLRLHIVGPITTSGTALLDLLGCFCRHPLYLAKVEVDSIASLPRGLSPTIIHLGELRRTSRDLLDSHYARVGILRGRGQCVPLECTFVTYSSLIEDLPQSPTAIEVPILSGTDFSPLSRDLADVLADKFQSPLLTFRIKTLSKAAKCDFHEPKLRFPVRALARCLACCTPESPDLQLELATLLAGTDERLRVEHSTTPQSLVVEVLLFFVHEEDRDRLHVAEITQAVNTLRSGRGEPTKLKDRSVGHVLKTLGLRTKRLDGAGRGILLLAEVREFIHRLARKFAVPSVASGPANCELCAES